MERVAAFNFFFLIPDCGGSATLLPHKCPVVNEGLVHVRFLSDSCPHPSKNPVIMRVRNGQPLKKQNVRFLIFGHVRTCFGHVSDIFRTLENIKSHPLRTPFYPSPDPQPVEPF